jgi:hypothetical protein
MNVAILHLQGRKSPEQETSLQQVARQKMEVIHCSETSDHFRNTWRYIPKYLTFINVSRYHMAFFAAATQIRFILRRNPETLK